MRTNEIARPVGTTLTIQTEVDGDEAQAFYRLYARAFAPLRTVAAARQELTREEFLDEMQDVTVLKLVARGDDGRPLGLATLATDLSCVPWISPEFFTLRYPSHAARGALYYVGCILATREARGGGTVATLIDAITRRVVDDDAICLYDVCGHNDEHLRLKDRFESRATQLAPVTTDRLDSQIYYAIYPVPAAP